MIIEIARFLCVSCAVVVELSIGASSSLKLAVLIYAPRQKTVE